MRQLAVAVVGMLLGLAVLAPGAAQGGAGATAPVEVRVWQNVGDLEDIYISARPAGGSWRTLGTTPLPLDDGVSPSGQYRYGDIALDVPGIDRALSAIVEVRVWQDVDDGERIYISARPANGSWRTHSTIRLQLDGGLSSTGRYRYGDTSLVVGVRLTGVTTFAGEPGVWGYADAKGEDIRFGAGGAFGLEVDRDGSLVVADPWNHAIRRIAPDGTATTLAGGNGLGLLDGPADVAQFERPLDVALSPDGSIYVADTGNGRIRKIGADGMVTTVAGSDPATSSPWETRDGPALEAVLREPLALALDAHGNLYITEQFRIRSLSPSGWVSTFAGGQGISYRDGPAEEAEFRSVLDIDVDHAGNVYVLDVSNVGPGEPGAYSTIRLVDTSGRVSTLHKSANPSYGGTLAQPSGMAVTGSGQVFLSNTGRNQIVRLVAGGHLGGVAGTGGRGAVDGPLGEAQFEHPGRLAIAPDGSLFVVDQGGTVIRKVAAAGDGVPLAVAASIPRVEGVSVSVLAGREGLRGHFNGPAHRARFQYPLGLALDPSGNVLVADTHNHAIRRVDPEGTVTTLAGGSGEGTRDGPSDVAQFSSPRSIAVAPDGTAYVVDEGSNRIRRVAPDGSVATLANGIAETFHRPRALATDGAGNLYISDTSIGSIGRLSPDGEIFIVVRGVGVGAIALDAEGAVYYPVPGAVFQSIAIRSLGTDRILNTLFEDTRSLYGGLLASVRGLAVAPDGAVYVADRALGRIIRISPEGEAAIVVGHDSPAGQGFEPWGLAVLSDGSLVVADRWLSVIWKVTFEDEDDE